MKWKYHIEEIWQAKQTGYIEARFDELGADGWELVSSVERDPSGGGSPSVYFIFKQPISK